jgi:hypothetical protein
VSKLSPDRMSQNKSFMAEMLRLEEQFYASITMDDVRAEEIRRMDRDWPVFYLRKRDNGSCHS